MIAKYINFYKDNLKNSVIPFWLKYSQDMEFGGCFTCLERDGSIYDTKKYIWLQGRCLWMLCRLYRNFETNPRFMDFASLILNFINKYAEDETGGYYFSVTRDGKPYCRQVDVYGKVFCMLGYLEYSKVTGNQNYFGKSKLLFEQIARQINEDSQAGAGGCYGRPAISVLTNQMVLADMVMQLCEAENKQQYQDMLKDILSCIMRHYHADKKVLVENIAIDGSDITQWAEGRFFCPGHSVEVAWFVLKILKFIPNHQIQMKMYDVIENSLEMGWDKECGGLCNFIDIENKSGILIESYTKLWWPHCEALYAILCAYKDTDDPKWLYWLKKVHNYVVDHFVDDEKGEWFGFCDRYGNLINNAKGSHSKGFFHTPRALLYCSQLYQ